MRSWRVSARESFRQFAPWVQVLSIGNRGCENRTSASVQAFAKASHAGSAEAPDVKNADPLPFIKVDKITRDCAAPVQRANNRIVYVDSAGMDATDNTVDADGKSLEAKRDLSVWHDNVISSNATLGNNVPAPADGLGGIDSRPTGNMPDILPWSGFHVVYCATVYEQRFNGARDEHVIRLERTERSRPRYEE